MPGYVHLDQPLIYVAGKTTTASFVVHIFVKVETGDEVSVSCSVGKRRSTVDNELYSRESGCGASKE